MTLKATRFQDLAPLRRSLAEAAAREALRQQQRAEAVRRALEEQNLFENTVGAVTPLRSASTRRWQPSELPAPEPRQFLLDEQRVLREAMSDEFDVSTLLDVDDQLSFRRPGIGLDVTRKLRGGHWSIQRQLDLHGLRSDEAREALGQFIRLSHRTGVRCVRIVHGKGLGSPGRTPVLKGKVQRWLVQKKEVLAFVQARPAEGGAGALVVLLQPGKRKLF
ncbi:Smr/MutS family protein [Comamonas testosteroni]|uniref:Smr/MutS family protein n=2 Tax=Comamonas TaxID=283 RepID=UPI0026602D07|nr:Smr/MutS family protein [Comamonas testosteroni]WKL14290.1 Smr/MutS family protein [Comamonas testosteroni]